MNSTSAPIERPLRTFVAIEVPAAIQTQLGKVAAGLQDQLPGRSVRWVPPQNMHLTLRFIGNVPSSDLEALKTAVRSAAGSGRPLSLQLGRPGCFPGEHSPRVLWIGLDGDIEVLSRLHSSVVEATAYWGEIGQRAFHPHLTLGRVVTTRRGELQQISRAIQAAAVSSGASWDVTSIHLIQSVLAPDGAQYSTLLSAPLVL